MRNIKKIHRAEYRPIGTLITYSPLPSAELHMMDPFIFLNHHGPQHFDPHNTGLPFGPHPHRGIETVTFVINGELVHKDNTGKESTITDGGVQWMCAGSGIIHAEVSSENFKLNGGDLEILQLWLNLPSHNKMSEPFYVGLQAEEIPMVTSEHTKCMVQVLSGKMLHETGPFITRTNAQLYVIHLKATGDIQLDAPADHTVFFYVVRGRVRINKTKELQFWDLPEFDASGDTIFVEGIDDAIIIFGHGKPHNERIVAHGPFVMNSEEEIYQAYEDFRTGKFGAAL